MHGDAQCYKLNTMQWLKFQLIARETSLNLRNNKGPVTFQKFKAVVHWLSLHVVHKAMAPEHYYYRGSKVRKVERSEDRTADCS